MNLNVKQKKAFEKLSKLKCGALFMHMGTGKTRVAIEIINSKFNEIDLVIWIAPASLLRTENYHNEINKWGIKSPVKFFSIESISSSDTKFCEMIENAKKNRCFCVVDESITIKNTDAGRTQRLLKYYNLFNYRLILNGTPLTQGLIDLYSQIQFLSPKILNMTEAQFANNFLIYKNEYGKPWKRWSKPENEEALIEIIRPYIFDADLEIPVKIKFYDYNLHLNDNEWDKYNREKEIFLCDKYQIGFLAVAQKFQNIYTNSLSKQEKLNKLLKEIKERKEKVIIYVKFLNEIESMPKDAVIYTGKQKEDLSKFRKDKDILVCTYGVGSFGLNLQFANNIIYYTQTFDYKDKIQSQHRIYRTGQKKDVNIYNFWLNTGLDKLIKNSLNKKENVLNNVEKIISKDKALKL